RKDREKTSIRPARWLRDWICITILPGRWTIKTDFTGTRCCPNSQSWIPCASNCHPWKASRPRTETGPESKFLSMTMKYGLEVLTWIFSEVITIWINPGGWHNNWKESNYRLLPEEISTDPQTVRRWSFSLTTFSARVPIVHQRFRSPIPTEPSII